MTFSYYDYPGGNTGYRPGGVRTTVSSYRSRPNGVILPRDRDLMSGLHGEAIQAISKPQVDAASAGVIRPENVKYIGSYNWVDEASPTIIVPGTSIVLLS